jgi:hypothetical protein
LQELEKLYFSARGYTRFELQTRFGIEMGLLAKGIDKLRKSKNMRDQRHKLTRVARPKDGPPLLPAVPLVPMPPEQPPETAVRLLQLEPQHCRWPYGEPKAADFCYCGADNHGGTYCHWHRHVARAPGARQAL